MSPLNLMPLVDDRAIRVHIERDDSTVSPVVDYAGTSQTRSDAEAALWSSDTAAYPQVVELHLDASEVASRNLTGLTIGTRYLIEIAQKIGGIDMKVGVTGKSSVDIVTRYPMTYRAEFTATAVTHVLTVTNLNSSSGNVLSFSALKVSPRPAQQVIMGPRLASGGDSAWTAYTGGTGTTYNKTMAFAGLAPLYYLSMNYDLSIVSKTFVPMTMVSRDLTGLTVGATYRVTVNGFGGYMSTSSAVSITNFYWTARLAGGAQGNIVLGQGVSVIEFVATATTHTINLGNTTGFTAYQTSYYDVYLHAYQFQVEKVPTTTETEFTIVSLLRSDANGTREVRLPQGPQALDHGVYVIDDFEHSLTGLVTYTAITTSPSNAQVFATGGVNVTGLWTDSHIAPAVLPRLGTEVEIVETYDSTSETSSVVSHVIGRADPLINIGFQRTRSGTMRVWCRDYNQAREVVETAGRGSVLLYRQPDYRGLDMYFVAGSPTLSPQDTRTETRRWSVMVPYNEVAFPTDPLLGAADWNFDASGDRNATFLESLREFASFTDLKVGPTDV